MWSHELSSFRPSFTLLFGKCRYLVLPKVWLWRPSWTRGVFFFVPLPILFPFQYESLAAHTPPALRLVFCRGYYPSNDHLRKLVARRSVPNCPHNVNELLIFSPSIIVEGDLSGGRPKFFILIPYHDPRSYKDLEGWLLVGRPPPMLLSTRSFFTTQRAAWPFFQISTLASTGPSDRVLLAALYDDCPLVSPPPKFGSKRDPFPFPWFDDYDRCFVTRLDAFISIHSSIGFPPSTDPHAKFDRTLLAFVSRKGSPQARFSFVFFAPTPLSKDRENPQRGKQMVPPPNARFFSSVFTLRYRPIALFYPTAWRSHFPDEL